MPNEPEIRSVKNGLDQSSGDEEEKLKILKLKWGSKAAYDLLQKMQPVPAPVNRRIKALKRLQLEQIKLESQFFREIHELENKYYKKYETYYDKRCKIVTGEYEPNDEECVWESDDDDESLANEIEEKAKIESKNETGEEVKSESEEKKVKEEEENIVGIPEFWLTIFKNVSLLADLVQEHDEPILKHLYDIKVEHLDSGFKLLFYFSPNEHFSNSFLTKEYVMRFYHEEKDPFSYDGPEIIKAKGCIIDWKKGKNVTMKIVKKNQKHKSKGSTRTVTETVQNDSFFNFFNPPTVPDDDAEIDDEIQALLNADFEIGHYIRERILQRAVLYYTGEILEDEDDDFEEEEHDEDDDLEEEEEEEENPRQGEDKPNVPIEY